MAPANAQALPQHLPLTIVSRARLKASLCHGKAKKPPSPGLLYSTMPLLHSSACRWMPLMKHWLQSLLAEKPPTGPNRLRRPYAGHQFGGFLTSNWETGARCFLANCSIPKGSALISSSRDRAAPPSPAAAMGRRRSGRCCVNISWGKPCMRSAFRPHGALAAVTTGEQIRRQGLKPGAVLARVASSHIRVGTFQFFRRTWRVG